MFSTIADEVKALRTSVGFSKSELARRSHVARWKITACELGDTSLTPEELAKVRSAVQTEIDRVRALPTTAEHAAA